jgi:hypothetical protein
MVSLAHVLREGGGSHTNACLSGRGFELVYVGPTLPVIPETSSHAEAGPILNYLPATRPEVQEDFGTLRGQLTCGGAGFY